MDAREIEAMLLRDRQEWDALVAVLEAHPEESLHPLDSPTWTSRNVYIHLANCIGDSLAQMEAKLTGAPQPQFSEDEDESNASKQRQYDYLTSDEARDWASHAFEQRIQAVLAVPADRWDAELEEMAGYDGWAHYAGHRSYINVA